MTAPLTNKLRDECPDRLDWEKSEQEVFKKLKKSLVTAPALGLPNLKKPFHLYVVAKDGFAISVMTQKKGGTDQPVAYFSRMLDPVVRGWPLCLQTCAAAALVVKMARKFVWHGTIILHSPHQLRTILTSSARQWMTDSRLLQLEAVLLERPDLILASQDGASPIAGLSPALNKEMSKSHHCIEIINLQTKPREDLEETPIEGARNLFVDGSSRVLNGRRVSGYAVIEEGGQEIESGALPSSVSAQTAELYALKRALELSEGGNVNIFSDSRYACGVIHVFGKIWLERGLLTSRGKSIAHVKLIREVMEALQKPAQVAVVHIPGHQKGNSMTSLGNRLADEKAKQAALRPLKEPLSLFALIPRGPQPTPPFKYSQAEIEKATSQGARDEGNQLVLPDGRVWLPKGVVREVFKTLHEGGHWGTAALVDAFIQKYVGMGVWTVAKQIIQNCVICQKVNKRGGKDPPPGGRPLALRPFQSLQVDFIELPPVGRLKYCLVITDQLTGWVEAIPAARATTGTVVKAILEGILPRFGLPERLDSDRGPHFIGRVLQTLMELLGIEWRHHTPWHPQSSGQTEKMNQTIKHMLKKLIAESQLPWTKVLPLALFNIRTKPRTGIGLSPFEMLYGFSIWEVAPEQPAEGIHELKDVFVKKYVLSLFSILSANRKRGLTHQTPPLEVAVHSIQPGDWVLLKKWKSEPLQPNWQGPYQVLLVTETAVRTAEGGWTHHTRVKKNPAPADKETQWTVKWQPEQPLKLTLRRSPANADVPS